ncbi:MAG: NAD-dependent epimerase [Betaproteobacteria bacterium]|nr:NAD-dependent epimerase [Betaproteobacteria bacterium]
MKILITGVAGFIGHTLAIRMLERGDEVVGIDNLNHYYDVRLKENRLVRLSAYPKFRFIKLDLADRDGMKALFATEKFDKVMNLAAQAGVRYSIENPQAYIEANIVGFTNVLEGARHNGVQHLVYASSSSVYGANTKLPFAESDSVDHPISLYAASKKANELMAHTYSDLFKLPTTGLRFFTVYGPWGRPDMALFKFTKAILASETIQVFNHGNMVRDFTYIDDIIEGVVRVIDNTAQPDPGWTGNAPNPATSYAPYRVYNIGNNSPVQLMRYINALEDQLGKKAIMEMLPMQPGDVPATQADVSRLEHDVGFKPATKVEDGIAKFVKWYRDYYKS